jgi:hypothetical protein
MWACSRCGTEHEKLHDARWNCPCRNDPEVTRACRARMVSISCSMLARVALAPALGAVAGTLVFFVGDLQMADRTGLGVGLGFIVGIIWAVTEWCTYLWNPAKYNLARATAAHESLNQDDGRAAEPGPALDQDPVASRPRSLQAGTR